MIGSRIKAWLVSILGLGVVVATAFWAGSTLSNAGFVSAQGRQFTTVPARQGQVERHLSLNAVASWPTGESAVGRSAGVVTSVNFRSGTTATPGETLYTVNLRPVLIADGAVPMFRDLSAGAVGPDVRQLQVLLESLDYFHETPDGQFDAATTAAVSLLQKHSGIDVDGTVRAGDVVFASIGHHARVRLASDVIRVGATLAGGETVLSVLPRAPVFTLPVTADQAAQITAGTAVRILNGSKAAWSASIGQAAVDAERGVTVISLQARHAKSAICRDTCAQVPIEGETTFGARIQLVRKTTGITIPTSSLISNTSGTISVVRDDGKRVEVSVLAEASGTAVVEGVPVNTRVRIPANPRTS